MKKNTDKEYVFPNWIIKEMQASGITPETMTNMGIFPIKNKTQLLHILGFSCRNGQEILRLAEAYALPYPDTEFCRIKLSTPLDGAKYLSPTKKTFKNAKEIYTIATKEQIHAATTIVLVEGEKKTAKVQQEIEIEGITSAVCLGMPGVTMWDVNKIEQLTQSRDLIIAFDSDFVTNQDVAREMLKLAFLSSKSKIMTWNQAYKGIDDYLVATNVKMSELLANTITIQQAIAMLPETWRETVLVNAITKTTDSQKQESLVVEYCDQYDKSNILTQIEKKTRIPNTIFQDSFATYIVKDGKGKDAEPISFEIAAFYAKVVEEIATETGLEYTIELETAKNKAQVQMTGTCLSNYSQFRDKIMNTGLFLYHVSDIQTHNLFLKHIFELSEIKKVAKSKYLGMVTDGWLCSDGLLQHDGVFLPFGSSPLLPPTSRIHRELSYCKNNTDNNLFVTCHDAVFSVCSSQTWKIFGFAMASFFSGVVCDVFAGYNSMPHFPLLFFYGKRHTGKSSLAGLIQSILGCKTAIGEYAFATQKANQRVASQYRNCVMVLNEYTSGEQNNKMLCQLHDREGYNRAKRDMTLDIESVDIHSTFCVISTLNIVGAKSEDVHSRLIEVDTDRLAQNSNAFVSLAKIEQKLSACLPVLIQQKKAYRKRLFSTIESLREKVTGVPARIIENAAAVWAGYETFLNVLVNDARTLECCTVDDAIAAMKTQTNNTNASDLGNVFLAHLKALVQNNDIHSSIAKMDTSNTQLPKLVFHLPDAMPFVSRLYRQSGIENADIKTIAKSLRLLGAEKTQSRTFGDSKKVWTYEYQEGTTDDE